MQKYYEHTAKLGQHTKFEALWKGPFRISACKEKNAYELEDLEGNALGKLVNDIYLNFFH